MYGGLFVTFQHVCSTAELLVPSSPETRLYSSSLKPSLSWPQHWSSNKENKLQTPVAGQYSQFSKKTRTAAF